MSAVDTPPDAPWTNIVCPGRRPDFTKSIRYAVSHAVPMTAACTGVNPLGLGSALRAGTTT